MRVTMRVDSATPQEVYDLTCAFQRTRAIPLPQQLTTTPTVEVAGSAMTWTSPAMHPAQVGAIMREFTTLQEERWIREELDRERPLSS